MTFLLPWQMHQASHPVSVIQLKAGISKTEISQELNVSVHTINYELRKNNMTALTYDANKAQKYKLLKGGASV